MKAAFLILSAINQNSVDAASALTQLQQHLLTLERQFEHSPNAVIEYSEKPLGAEQKQLLLQQSDLLAEFRPNELLSNLKNERLAMGNPIDPLTYQKLLKIIALNWFLQNAHGADLFKDIDYVFIIESEATLELDFINFLAKSDIIKNKLFFKKAITSQAQNEKGRTLMHYPTNCWAYSAELTNELIDNIIEASENAYKLLEKPSEDNTHTDLGHELFKVVDLSKVHFVV